jgi:hypothetical protein
MPSIARYEPRVPTPKARLLPLIQAPRITGDGLGAAIAGLGESIERGVNTIDEARSRELYRVTEANISAHRAWQAAQLRDLETAPADEVDERADKFLAESRQSWQGIVDRLPERSRARGFAEGVRDDAQLELVDKVERFRSTAQGLRTAQTFEQSLADRARDVEADPDSFLRNYAEHARAAEHAMLSQGAQAAQKRAAFQTLVSAATRGAIRRDPAGTLAQLQSEDPTAQYIRNLSPEERQSALKVAEAAVRDGTITDYTDKIARAYRDQGPAAGARLLARLDEVPVSEEVKDAVRNEVHARNGLLRDERRAENLEAITSLSTAIARGDPPRTAERDAYSLYRRGALSESEFVNTREAIARARQQAGDRDADRAALAEMITAGRALDPADATARKAVSTEFRERTRNADPLSPEFVNQAVALAKQTRVVPDSAVAWARTALVSDNINAAAFGGELLARLEEAAPQSAGFAIDERTRTLAADISSAVRAGAVPAQAVELARRNAARPESERERLRERYRTEKLEGGNDEALQGFLDGDDRFDRSLIRGAPAAPEAMAAEFSAGVRRYFDAVGGDVVQARRLAWNDATRKWAFSTAATGKPAIVPYAPELHGISRADVEKDFAKALADHPAQVRRFDPVSGDLVAASPSPKDLRLVPIPGVTERTAGLRWNVAIQGDDGSVDLLRGSDNLPLAYELPVTAQDFRERREAQGRQALERARRVSAEQRSDLDQLEEMSRAGDDFAFSLLQMAPRPAPGIR